MLDAATVLADYHQLFLAPAGVQPVCDPAEPTDLLAVADDSLIIFTGITFGPVRLTVTDREPAGPWPERASTRLRVTGPLYVIAPTVTDDGIAEPVYTPARPGTVSVTVLARGRDRDPDAFLDPDDEPVEDYAVVIRAEESPTPG